MCERKPDSKRLAEGIEIIVDEAKAAAKSAYRRSGVESVGENLRETLQSALSRRDAVVMVRLNKSSMARVDDLVEAGVVKSRSEAAAFLVEAGLKARVELFERISEKIDKIREAKQELRDLLDETPAEESVAEEAQPEQEQPQVSQDPGQQE